MNLLIDIIRKKCITKNGCKPEGIIQMIKIVAENYIKDENIQQFITQAKILVLATTQNDPGCISYELFQDTSNPRLLTIIEEWESEDAIEKHIKAEHFKESVALFSDWMGKPTKINFYQKLG
jgi:quinol monooxygenase YgiN